MDDTSIDARFAAFHTENPHVLALLVRLAREAKARGMERIGAKALIERARWEISLQTRGDEYRLNNSFASRYARLIADTCPDLATMFQFRRLAA
jgi:hypothetical protein